MSIVHGLSIDVEEYFHALNLRPAFPESDWLELPRRADRGVDLCLEMLDRAQCKATFFVLGWVAEHEPELVERIAREGHEIASHGHSHKMAGELGPEGFENDVRTSLELLHGIRGVDQVSGFRASTFSITRKTWWSLDILARLGLRYDSSVFPVRHDRYGVPDFARVPVEVCSSPGRKIVELPLLTLRALGMNLPAAGGGYLRQFPLGYIRAAIRRMAKAGHPAIVYLHPWELDPGQPRAPASAIGRLGALRHYRNIDRTAERLSRLLEEFSFGPLEPIAREVEDRTRKVV